VCEKYLTKASQSRQWREAKTSNLPLNLTFFSPFFLNIIKLLTRGEIWISANFMDPIHGAMVAHAM
jgi:hypothetical protein